MGFRFNLFSLAWPAHKDALGNPSTAVPEWLASLSDELPVVREEAFGQLEELLVSGAELAPAAALVAEPLLRLVESELCWPIGLRAGTELRLEGRQKEHHDSPGSTHHHPPPPTEGLRARLRQGVR